MKNKLWLKYGLRFFVMIFLVILFFKWINIFESYTYLSTINLFYLGLAIGAIAFANVIKGFRFIFLTRAINLHLPFWKSFWVNEMALIVGRVTPAKLGEGIKVMYLDAKKTDLSFCFAMERLGDIVTIFIFALLGISLFTEFLSTYFLFGIVVFGLIFGLYYLDKILNFLFRKHILEEKWFKNNLKKFSFSDWVIYGFWTLLVRVGVLSLPVLINISLGIDLHWLVIFEMYAIAIMVGNISALPGGFGAREGSYTFLLSNYNGVITGLAGIASVLITFVDLFVESLLSLISFIVLKVFYR